MKCDLTDLMKYLRIPSGRYRCRLESATDVPGGSMLVFVTQGAPYGGHRVECVLRINGTPQQKRYAFFILEHLSRAVGLDSHIVDTNDLVGAEVEADIVDSTDGPRIKQIMSAECAQEGSVK